MVVETRNRLPSSKTSSSNECKVCQRKDGTSWLQCERCRQWVHSVCMGYTVEEFKFLDKSKNVLFVCDECLADDTAHALDTVNSLSLEIVNLKNSVDEIKEAVCNGSRESVTQELQELKSVVQKVKETTAVTSEAKLTFPIPKSKIDYNFELRFSGIPEFNSSAKSANRKDIFEHDEKLLKDVIKVLGVDGYEISSFRRIGQFKPENPRPRLILVKFSQEYSVDKILSRTAMLKDYNPSYNEHSYSVFISKSLNPEEQKHEQKLLKKRRDLLNAGEKQLRIRNGVLYLKDKPISLEE